MPLPTLNQNNWSMFRYLPENLSSLDRKCDVIFSQLGDLVSKETILSAGICSLSMEKGEQQYAGLTTPFGVVRFVRRWTVFAEQVAMRMVIERSTHDLNGARTWEQVDALIIPASGNAFAESNSDVRIQFNVMNDQTRNDVFSLLMAILNSQLDPAKPAAM